MDNLLSIWMKPLLIQAFMVFFIHIVQSSECPPPCNCVFDDVWENNLSKCDFGNASVNITWQKLLGRPVMTISCQGTNYTCEDLPQFDIHNHQVWVILKSCTPNTLRCLNDIYFQQPSAIESVEIHNMTTPDKTADWEKLANVWDLRLYLKGSRPLPVYPFSGLPSLKQIYIEGGDFNKTVNTNVKSSIETLILHKMDSKTLPNAAFDVLKKNIKKLQISGTQFESLNVATFEDMIYLEELLLRNNDIKSLDVIRKAPRPNTSSLKTFKMENNSVRFLPNNMFDTYDSLNKIIIENNQVEMVLGNQALARLKPQVVQVELNNCKIKELPEDVLLGTSNAHNIHINDNLIEKIHPNTFKTTKSVRRLSLSGNRIQSLSGDMFINMRKMEFLDLSGNRIQKLRKDTFEFFTLLKTLLLNDNNISELEKDVFKGLKFITVSLASNRLRNVDALFDYVISPYETRELNLSHNDIEVFEDRFFKQGLEYLDLSSNKIKELSNYRMNIHQSTKLTINLRNNSINHIFGDINSFPSRTDTKLKLYLSENPFECDCISSRILHDWNSKNMIADFKDLTCKNGMNISTMDVYVHCNKTHAKIALIGTSVVGTLFGFIVLLSIVTRWNDIWKFISKYLLKQNSDFQTLDMDQGNAKDYDIFISFAHQDEAYVSETLLPRLEFEYGQKVCVHYRDWIVGQTIPDQIIQSVENARITIIILTESFLMSDWSSLEFRTAHSLSQQEGKPRVIVILINESITKDERLSEELKSYIAKNSYLVAKEPYFWKKLEKRMLRSGL